MKNKIFLLGYYILALILVAILPINDKNSGINHTYILTIRLDYVLHALLFLPWMFLAPKPSPDNTFVKSWLTRPFNLFFCGILISLVSEGVQLFISYRSFNLKDLTADIIGLALSLLVTSGFKRIYGNSK